LITKTKITKTTSAKPPPQPVKAPTKLKLRFSHYAWARPLFLHDLGRAEVGGFADLRCLGSSLIEMSKIRIASFMTMESPFTESDGEVK
jgi:hypothetical protein